MKKIIRAIMLIGILAFAGCSSDAPKVTNECKLLKYGKVEITDPNGIFTYYQVELVYQNNQIVKRLNYGNIASTPVIGLISTDNIFYDSNNRVEKIVYINNIEDHFYYEGNAINPFKRERWSIHPTKTYVYIEDITYDTQNRILKTVYYPRLAPTEITTTDYTYNSDGNLIEIVEDDGLLKTTYYRSNYDTYKNPFATINVPFIENRIYKYSKNNASEFITKAADGTILYHSSVSGRKYNEFGFPIDCEYLCN